MAVIQPIVESAESFMTNAARSTFLGLVEASGTLVGYMAVLAVALVGVNMLTQARPMAVVDALALSLKLALIGIFAWNWTQFWAVADAILRSIDSVAGGILLSSGNGLAGDTIADGFGAAIDDMMAQFTLASTSIAEEMGGLFTTAIISGICFLLIGTVSAIAAILILFPKIVITVLLGLAPIAIAMTIFSGTKGYFERWLSSCITWSLYPLFIASIFSIMVSMGTDMINRIGTDGYGSVGDFIPFVVLMILILISMALLPTLVSSISGSFHTAGIARTVGMAASNVGTLKRAGSSTVAGASALARTPGQTLRGENAVGRAGQAFAAHLAVSRATTGVAASITRMQDKAKALSKH